MIRNHGVMSNQVSLNGFFIREEKSNIRLIESLSKIVLKPWKKEIFVAYILWMILKLAIKPVPVGVSIGLGCFSGLSTWISTTLLNAYERFTMQRQD